MSRILMRHRLWKTVQNFSGALEGLMAGGALLLRSLGSFSEMTLPPLRLNACSACAGNYEDPDRTAGYEAENNEAEDEGENADGDKFPAEAQ